MTKEELLEIIALMHQRIAGHEKERSEQKQAEEALRESREHLCVAVDAACIAVWNWKTRDNYVVWSNTAEEVLGFQPGSFGNNYEAYMKWVHPDDIEPINDRVSQAIEEKKVEYRSEYRVIRPNGEIRWISAPGQILYDSDGKPLRIAGIMMDITKRKLAEQELVKHRENLEELIKERTEKLVKANESLCIEITERKKAEETIEESEEKYRTLFERESDAIFIFDPDTTNIIDCNKATSKMYGYDKDELIGMSCLNFSSEVEKSASSIDKLHEDSEVNVPYRLHRKKDGTVFPVEINGYAITLGGEKVMYAVSKDITERKQVEKEMKDLAKFPSENPNPVLRIDDQMNILYRNEAVIGILEEKGLSEDNIFRILPDDLEEIIVEALEKGKPFYGQEVAIDSRVFSYSITPVPECRYVNLYAVNVTESKRAEEEIEKFKTISDRANYGAVIVDLEGNILYVNNYFASAHGLDSDEIIGENLAIFHNEEQMKSVTEINKKLEANGSYSTEEIWHKHKDGSVFPMLMNATVIKDDKGTPMFMSATAVDITERKRMEKALYDSEQKYREIVEGTNDLITRVNNRGEFLFVNQMAKKIFGFSADECIGKLAFEFIHPDDRLATEAWFNECIQKKLSQDNFENRLVNQSNGNVHHMLWTVKFNYDEDGQVLGINSIARDITERKQLEEELQKMHKLESIGILAGGIAHDFNNLLAAIRNNVYLSKMLVDRESRVYESMESAENILNRATDLTQQLLTFARGGAPVKKTASIVELIKESAEFVLRGSSVNCAYNIADNLWPVEVDEGQINQVIHNLILNAVQSMPKGGTIRISTDNSNVGSNTGLLLQEGRYVKIVINDQGVGITEEHLKNVFDPYFTTKEMGRGLGLSITYSIIKNHNGHISVESETGVGTTFTIYLPASDKQVEEKETIEYTFVAGEGKILLMDDEEIIRETAEQLLTHKGYEIECAKDGGEAIELYKKAMVASKPFDVVILDLTIRGGMGGKEAVKKLQEIDPDVKAIVASGYSNDPVLANYSEYGFVGVFAKHDKAEELGKVLHKVINGHQ